MTIKNNKDVINEIIKLKTILFGDQNEVF